MHLDENISSIIEKLKNALKQHGDMTFKDFRKMYGPDYYRERMKMYQRKLREDARKFRIATGQEPNLPKRKRGRPLKVAEVPVKATRKTKTKSTTKK